MRSIFRKLCSDYVLVKACQRDAHFKVARYLNAWQRIEKRGLEIEKSELVCYFLFQFVNFFL